MNSRLGRAGLSSLHDAPKAQVSRAHQVGKKNYLQNDDSDDDDTPDGEAYHIEPSVQLFKSIDFGRQRNNSEFETSSKGTSSQNAKKLTSKASFEFDSKPLEYNPALTDNSSTLLRNGKAVSADNEFEPDMSKTERDSLMDALDKMRKQNDSLVKQMESTQKESRLQLEKERAERVSVVNRMQEENTRLTQTLLKAQLDAEAALDAEKEKLRLALRAMELEKSDLIARIRTTEENAREEQFRIQYQKAEFERNIQLLEQEKQALIQRVNSNAAELQRTSGAASQALTAEREMLQSRLRNMELERDEMVKAVKSVEADARDLAESMSAQLAKERDELRVTLERMEIDKRELSASLLAKETEAADQANALKDQLAKDKSELLDALRSLEVEKDDLALKVSAAEKFSRVSEDLQRERREMKLRLEAMEKEKADLAEKLRTTEAATAERNELEAAKVANEKRELMETVQKMKAELEASRLAGSNDDISQQVSAGRSLFAMMEGQGTSPVKRYITAIPEGDEGESFMNLDDDEDGERGQNSGMFSDLPAPHEAAALGDLSRLQVLGGLEPSLLLSVDASSRSPLFYAAAYGHIEAAKFLAEKSPNMIVSPDSHGDTALHAAASAGRTECLQELLAYLTSVTGDANIDPRNHMGMSPIHMACSAECMELLYTYGADIAALDEEGRSPLFVACAMNRVECAEFLINSLDSTETSLLLKDKRGDTPLHAAACNGSEDCLLLLLQFGIDPCVINDKGLKAIELAIKNKQKRCRQLLAEYHLHYGTSSDFDSVLFLATLEGHKLAKSRVTGQSSTPYQIIKKSSFSLGESPLGGVASGGSFSSLARGKSLFSLSSDRSLRLQRWGQWIAYEDQTSKSVYWYNPNTCTGQWEKPEEVTHLQSTLAANNNMSASSRLLTGKMSMRLKKVGDWIQYVTGHGPTFYYNDKNGEFQWVDPENDDQASGYGDSDWKPYKDPQTGNVFWYNRVTKISQWECPLDTIPPELLLQSNQTNSSPTKYDEDDHQAVTVSHEDDLGI